MKLCAVVCEYNPFHSGHLYHLEKTYKATGCDGIICLMSGNFVQRAEPSAADKYARAECALIGGASMVVELPAVIACANGEKFAAGSIACASELPEIEWISAGFECGDEKKIETLANIQAEESAEFKKVLSEKLKTGLSYALSYTLATVSQAEKQGIDSDTTGIILSNPNNLLCISYLKALKKANSPIKMIMVKRKGNGYNNLSQKGDFLSASAIRQMLYKDRTAIIPFIPAATRERLFSEIDLYPVNLNLYGALTVNKLREMSAAEIALLPDVSEGLEYKLKEAADKLVSLENVLESVKSKRYTMSRLKRIALCALLGIDKTFLSSEIKPAYRILGIKEDFKHYLPKLSKRFYMRNDALNEIDDSAQLKLLNIDKRASEIYSLITGKNGKTFYSSRPAII